MLPVPPEEVVTLPPVNSQVNLILPNCTDANKVMLPSFPIVATATSATMQPRPPNEYINDVAFYRKQANGMSNLQIEALLKNVFIPDKSYSFPKTNKRSFLFKWLEDFPWLCYSPSLDGAFCLPCVLLGDRFPVKAARIKNLFSEPFRSWNDASRSFKKHTGGGTLTVSGSKACLHDSTSGILTSILSQLSGKTQPIGIMIDENKNKNISENKKKLIPIIDTIKLCGRLGLAFRGHRNDSKYHPDVGSYIFFPYIHIKINKKPQKINKHFNKSTVYAMQSFVGNY